MIYVDKVYGSATINEPVLLELFDSKAVRRLQGVLQHGISSMVGITAPTTRFEHSIGVMLLVRHYSGTQEEQIAALLHDVSHTAFSHVIDHVFNNAEHQSYHEAMKESYMAHTDLPAILEKYGYDWRDFIHETPYHLLEQPLPDLCADRLDYFLRDSLSLRLATSDECTAVLEHLKVFQGRFVIDDLTIARWLGRTFIAADEASWASFREVGLYEVTARAIQFALKAGVISESDFWTTDQQLWDKLQASGNVALREQLQLVSADTQFVWDEAMPSFEVTTKLRSVDPRVLVDGAAQPLSALDPEYAAYRNQYLESKRGKWPMRVVAAARA